jgi:hypothetical protein
MAAIPTHHPDPNAMQQSIMEAANSQINACRIVIGAVQIASEVPMHLPTM